VPLGRKNIYRIALDHAPIPILIQDGIYRLKRLHNRTIGIKSGGFDLVGNLFLCSLIASSGVLAIYLPPFKSIRFA